MRIYFLSRQPDVCQLMADRLSQISAEIKIFPLIPELFHDIFDMGNIPDILFLDFLYYQSDVFDLYTIFEDRQKFFPIVYYNHPFPIPEKRKYFWTFNLQKSGKFKDTKNIEPVLEEMEKALMDPNIAPYVSCIQNPAPYRSSDLRYIEPLKESNINYYISNFDNVISDSYKSSLPKTSVQQGENISIDNSSRDFENSFRNTHRLSHRLFILFKYLYERRNRHVSLSELSSVLSSGSQKLSANGIRLSIFRLRNILKEDLSSGLEILNYDYGYSMIESSKNCK